MTAQPLYREIARVHQQQLWDEADRDRLVRRVSAASSWQTWIEAPVALLRLTSHVTLIVSNRLVWSRTGRLAASVPQG
jgi:hypothetical protein